LARTQQASGIHLVIAWTGQLLRVHFLALHLAGYPALSRIYENDVIKLSDLGGNLRQELVTSQNFNRSITSMSLSDSLRHPPSDPVIAP
jgi:hypothetical protein